MGTAIVWSKRQAAYQICLGPDLQLQLVIRPPPHVAHSRRYIERCSTLKQVAVILSNPLHESILPPSRSTRTLSGRVRIADKPGIKRGGVDHDPKGRAEVF